jgi:hypothetical protein
MLRYHSLLNLAVGCVLPHTIYEIISEQRYRRRQSIEAERVRAIKDALHERRASADIRYSASDIVDFLVALGCPREDVTSGSIPDRSLQFCSRELEKLVTARPLFGLHVGNFIGVSLCHFTDFVRRLDERSIIVSIDPNLFPHMIANPIEKVVRCLSRYNLQDNSMILTGYSLEKSASNALDPETTYDREHSCENQLPHLAQLAPGRFDFAVIDGNHDNSYLAREVEVIDRLLKPGGIFVFDDVDWDSVGTVFHALDPTRHEQVASDGRVGLARKRLPSSD